MHTPLSVRFERGNVRAASRASVQMGCRRDPQGQTEAPLPPDHRWVGPPAPKRQVFRRWRLNERYSFSVENSRRGVI